MPLGAAARRPGRTKIGLLAGAPSSKPLAHEYFAGGARLLEWLRLQPGVWPGLARGWPADERVLEGARCVVYFGDGGGKQPFAEPRRWATLRRLLDGGAGLVLLHQAMDFPAGPDGAAIRGWLGAVYHSDIGSRGHWDMEFTDIPAHEVTRGVRRPPPPPDRCPSHSTFAPAGVPPRPRGGGPEKPRSTAEARRHQGRAEVIAWAHQRPAGGRGFGFTGADLHRSWSYPSQRTLVLNGILWSAGLPVPAGGVQVDLDPAALERNLDLKPAPAPAKRPTKAPAKATAP